MLFLFRDRLLLQSGSRKEFPPSLTESLRFFFVKQTAGLHLKKDLAKFDMLRTVVLPSFTPFPVYGAGPLVRCIKCT